MTTGTIDRYDPEKQEGFIVPDTPDGEHDKIPFESDALEKHHVTDLKVGDRVRYSVTGGMTGISANSS
jgi:cold shock CspA family protein